MGKYSEYFLVHENMLICNTCSWAIPKPKDCTTSSLRHHLRKKHPDLYSCFKDREDRTKYERATAAERAMALAHGLKRIWKSEPEAGPEPSQPKRPSCKAGTSFASVSEATIWEPPHRDRMDNIEKAITQLLCTAALPSSFVESPGFRNLISVISPRFHLKPRVHFTENSLNALYDEYITKMRTMLNSALFVSFSADVRVLPAGKDSLVTFTVHFIDDRMVPRFATVSANLFYGLPTPEQTRALLAKALNSFAISQEKVHILVEHWPIPATATSTYVKHLGDFSQKLQKVRFFSLCRS
ncbi:BED zinc finger [Ostertagia ostertagi]